MIEKKRIAVSFLLENKNFVQWVMPVGQKNREGSY